MIILSTESCHLNHIYCEWIKMSSFRHRLKLWKRRIIFICEGRALTKTKTKLCQTQPARIVWCGCESMNTFWIDSILVSNSERSNEGWNSLDTSKVFIFRESVQNSTSFRPALNVIQTLETALHSFNGLKLFTVITVRILIAWFQVPTINYMRTQSVIHSTKLKWKILRKNVHSQNY